MKLDGTVRAQNVFFVEDFYDLGGVVLSGNSQT